MANKVFHRLLIKDSQNSEKTHERKLMSYKSLACMYLHVENLGVTSLGRQPGAVGRGLKVLRLEMQRMELPEVRHGQPPRVSLTPVCCLVPPICIAATGH